VFFTEGSGVGASQVLGVTGCGGAFGFEGAGPWWILMFGFHRLASMSGQRMLPLQGLVLSAGPGGPFNGSGLAFTLGSVDRGAMGSVEQISGVEGGGAGY
jgi:hypothetical protein